MSRAPIAEDASYESEAGSPATHGPATAAARRRWWRRPQVPLVLQAEAAECGLACLAMVAGAHGLDIDLPALRLRCELSLKGVTAADLLNIAEALQLQGSGLRAEPEHLSGLRTPCVLHWDLNHFVVLVQCDGHHATVHDPARGRRRLTMDELSRHFTGVVLEFVPTSTFKPGRERTRLSLRGLLGNVHGLRRSLAQVLLLALVLEGFVLLMPFLMQWVVDEVVVSADRELLLVLVLGFGAVVLFQTLTAALRAWAVLALSASLNQQWLVNVFNHLMRLPLAWFERRQLGDVWSRYLSVQAIQRTLTTSFVEAVLDGVMVVLTVIMMALYSPPLLAVALVATALYAVLRWAFFAPLRAASEEALVLEARQNGSFIETLRGMQAIKLFNAQVQRRQLFAAQVSHAMAAQVATRGVESAFAVLHRLLFGLERVAVIGLGGWLVLERQLSVGMLLAFYAYKEQFSLRLAALIDKGVELAMLRLQAERLADIVLAEPEALGQTARQPPLPAAMSPSASQAPPAQAAPPSIELQGLRFAHASNEPEVLRGVSLFVRAGESVAIVGPSGCGKSTLVKVMLGLLPASGGEVLINGVPLARLGAAAWRAQVGTVMQDDQLFAGSIAANISFFAAEPDLAWVQACAQRVGLHEDIVAMPMGYQSLIGDMGNMLSGGQRQRLLLARALYKRPSVLVLDEATSALDEASERAVSEAVRQLALTRVIVAHRPQTVAAADRVVHMEQGHVRVDGSR